MKHAKLIKVTRQEIVEVAADRWWKQYGPYFSTLQSGVNTQDVHLKLLILPRGSSREEVDKIIGNNSWTKLECAICGEDADEVINFKSLWHEHSDNICRKCLKNMMEVMDESGI